MGPLELRALDDRQPVARTGKKLVIIDPGHGGKDNGATASRKINGATYYEKDIVLQIAQRIVPLFQHSPNLEVKLTRTGDEYVPLDDRILMADHSKGDLFISIHLNAYSGRSKAAHGMEIYYLSSNARSTNHHLEAIESGHRLADGEPQEASNLRAILGSLAEELYNQRRQESFEVCSVVEQIFRQKGPFATSMRGIKAADFRVLLNYNMPSILIECGFIDNPEESRRLIDASVQTEIASLLFNAINLYFAKADPNFQAYLVPVG